MHRQELALGRIRAELSQLSGPAVEHLRAQLRGGGGGAQAQYDQRARQGKAASGRRTLTRPLTKAAADEEARRIRDRVRQMGAVNVGAIEEYAQMQERFTELERAAHGPRGAPRRTWAR